MTDEPPWLDQILAAPAIGIMMAPWLGFASKIGDSLERLGNSWAGETRISAREPMAFRVERSNGTYLELSPDNFVFGYSYRMHLKERPGALPVLESRTETQKYTSLLSELLDDASAVMSNTVGKGTRTVIRIGIVADCRLVEKLAPPGAEALVAAVAGLWSKELKVVDADFVVECASTTVDRDQCHHGISKNDYDHPGALNVKLDWQRVWSPPVPMNREEVLKQLGAATEAAKAYFVNFGMDGGYLCRN